MQFIKIKLILLFFMVSFASISKAQVSFSHEFGAAIYLIDEVGPAYSVLYSPRINFLELSDEITLSAGTHAAFGLGGSVNSTGSGGIYYNIDLPLMLEINLGHNSHPEATSRFGGFAGAGMGYFRLGILSDGFGGNISSFGPVFNAGISAEIDSRDIGIRVSFLKNIKDGGANIISGGLFYVLGY